MKLVGASRVFFGVVLLALAANLAFLLLIGSAHSAGQAARARSDASLRFVDELRHETDRLARLVRAYTSTGDNRYLHYYYDIHAVRTGEKAAPAVDDADSYWEQVIAGTRRHALPPAAGGVSLSERAARLDFSAAEREAMQRVLDAAVRLQATEQVAFAATQGLYDASTGRFVDDGRPDREHAHQVVYGRDHERESAELAQAINVLAQLTAESTAAQTGQADRRLHGSIMAAVVVDIALALAVFVALRATHRSVVGPIDRLAGTARQLAGGDYTARTTLAGHQVQELAALAGTLDRMAAAIHGDLAERERVAHELEVARVQAEAATEAKSMFLANMSHEIRTPMNAIIGMTYLALRSATDPRQREQLDKAHSASRMLLRVLNDILDFSKIEAGRLDLERLPCRIDQVVGAAMDLVRADALAKGLDLRCDIDQPCLSGEGGSFWGDPLRLTQVMTNLLSNAVKFTEAGHVHVRVGLATPLPPDAPMPASATVLVRVRDSGVGMTAAQIDGLFREFTQADGSTTRRYGGTGLGLSISRRLLGLMGGTIGVHSTPGAGSEFTVALPVTTSLPPAAATLPAATSPGADASALHGLRVLLVEDNEVNQLLAVEVLRQAGARVVIAEDGRWALAQLAAHAADPFDVVLMDLEMPGMDGFEACRAIRRDARWQALPVIAMSAHAMADVRERCLASGMQDHVAKPIDPHGLVQRLAALQRRAPTPSVPPAAVPAEAPA